MIELSKEIAVNEPGMPRLTRSDVFAGLIMKANNALPFVAAITHCEVIEHRTPLQFEREIVLRGETMRELVTLEPETRVTFERLSGPVLGTIVNEIDEDARGSLRLRFAFRLILDGVAAGSNEEELHARNMESEYTKAVEATLSAIRTMALAKA